MLFIIIIIFIVINIKIKYFNTMKTIPEIVNYFNDDKAYILAEKDQFFHLPI